MSLKISASILSANPMQFEKSIRDVDDANIDLIHIDVMDGHFVPNITMGPFIVKGIKSITDTPLDIHLMIENPEKYVEAFAKSAGKEDILTFHIETTSKPEEVISMIKSYGLRAGVALNPATQFEKIKKVLDKADLVLVMTVNPGFSGQKFMEECLPKLEKIRSVMHPEKLLEVDGGITVKTAPLAVRSGANVLAAASSIFNEQDIKQAVYSLRESAQVELQAAV